MGRAAQGGNPNKLASKAMGCRCEWWGVGAIVRFDPDCPVGSKHRGWPYEPDDLVAIDPRIDRDQLFLHMAHLVALRSSCTRGHVGAVIVKDRRVISMGYNGSLPDQPHCYEVGCEQGPDGGCVRTIHAETNAVISAARLGIATIASTMYATHATCATCAALVVNAGIERFIYTKSYRLERLDILLESGLEVERLDLVDLPEH